MNSQEYDDIIANVLDDYDDAMMVDMDVFMSDLHSEFGSFDEALEAIASLDSDYDVTLMQGKDVPFDVMRENGYYLLLSESTLPE